LHPTGSPWKLEQQSLHQAGCLAVWSS
jgi:hypothetical protein